MYRLLDCESKKNPDKLHMSSKNATPTKGQQRMDHSRIKTS